MFVNIIELSVNLLFPVLIQFYKAVCQSGGLSQSIVVSRKRRKGRKLGGTILQ